MVKTKTLNYYFIGEIIPYPSEKTQSTRECVLLLKTHKPKALNFSDKSRPIQKLPASLRNVDSTKLYKESLLEAFYN